MKCKNCGAELIGGNSFCIQCGETITKNTNISDNDNKSEEPVKQKQSKKSAFVMISGIMSAVFLIIGIMFFLKGSSVKNDYYNSESGLYSQNAYVGGDAYNYIINGTYFTGYVTIGSVSMLCSIICLGNAFIISSKEK